MAKTTNGIDNVARAVGGSDFNGNTNSGGTVTYTATTVVDSSNPWTASSADGQTVQKGGLVGHIVVSGAVYGVVVSSAVGTLTVDYWHNPATPGGAAGTTPSASAAYQVLPGSAPAWYLGMTQTGTNGAVGSNSKLTSDGTVLSEIWNTGGAINRLLTTYAHTNGTATYTLSTGTLTTNANDPNPVTVNRVGIFVCGLKAAPSNTTTGTMLYETAVPSPPTLVLGDSISVTDTITIS